jgi:glycosyltransferase involved in cell wall biosynthesis
MNYKFTIVIPTKNRLPQLLITLEKLSFLLENDSVQFLICDDGSTDNTFEYIKKVFPKIEIFRNERSKGIHYTRNRMMERVKTPFAINIDDDIHLISQNPLEIIAEYFKSNPDCAIIGFRIFWSKLPPDSTESKCISHRVKSFGAGASAWRMSAWYEIPNFPEWFVFYGEEDYASYHLFKKGWEIHYLPVILVHHRVDIRSRKKEKEYRLRLRRSFRSGWYLFFLFYPWKLIPRILVYTLWIQFKTKTMKGDLKATLAIIQAIGDVIIHFPKLIRQNNRLSLIEYFQYKKLSDTVLYWTPEHEK